MRTLQNNIDLVQVNVRAGQQDYYLPKNVGWKDKVIDRVQIADVQSEIVSPIDGITPVLQTAQLNDLYVDLFAADDSQIARNLYYTALLSSNNNPLYIGEKLSLNLSNLHFSVPPTADGCILLYVYYGSKQTEQDEPRQSLTVKVPLAAGESMSFDEVVNNYIHIQPNKIRGVYVWESSLNLAYLTFQTFQKNRALNHLLTSLFRPPLDAASATETQVETLWLDELDINMVESYVRNASVTDAITVTITFLY